MSSYCLQLCPYYGHTIELTLFDEPGIITLKDCISDSNRSVRSDIQYSAKILGERIPDEYELKLYINGEEIRIKQNDNSILFCDNNERVFLSYLGLIQITIEIVSASRTTTLYTNYLPVLVRNNTVNNSVQRMAEYVYNHQEDFLLHSKLPSRVQRSIKPDSPRELESQLQIIARLIQVYSEQYQYFSTNAKFRLKPEGHVDDFERLQKVTSSTLSYIAQHPEQLTPVNYITGISRNRQQYVPRKVMIFQNTPDFNTYENRAVVNFLRTIILSICKLIEMIDKRLALNETEHSMSASDDYFNSTWFIMEVSRRKMRDYKVTLIDYKAKVERLYLLYSSTLSVSQEAVTAIPRPTPVFLSIPAYRLLYQQMDAWFRFGIYCFEKEDFMLPFTQTNKLYEYYVLLKLHSYIIKCGYNYQNVDIVSYPGLTYDLDSKYNTFHYCNNKSGQKITMYYEPAIYGKNNLGHNKIGLFRNTSRKFSGNRDSNPYYTPDYVIKIENNNNFKYIIMDAKFSFSNSIKQNQQALLVYKYLFSISTIKSSDSLLGMCLFCGKSDDSSDWNESMYDLSSRPIFPYAEILTLTENTPENTLTHFQLIDSVLKLTEMT